jgi:predicted phage tail protein
MADIDKLFEQISNDILTEETKMSMAVLFEQEVNDAIKAKEVELNEKNTKNIAAFTDDMVNKLDAYLTHFCEEFVKENTQVIEESVKVKTAERVLKTFSGLVKDFNLQLDGKVIDNKTAIAESRKEIETLTNKLIEAKKETKLREKAALVAEACNSLTTELQKAKLVEFAKGLPYDELFEKKIAAFSKTTLVEGKNAQKDTDKKEKLVITEEIANILNEKEHVEQTKINKYVENL